MAVVGARASVACLHVVLGEMVPKNIAIAGPDRAALVLGPPMLGVVTVLRPIIVSLNAIANGTQRLLKVEPKDELSSAFTREEVAALVEESRGEGLLEVRAVRTPCNDFKVWMGRTGYDSTAWVRRFAQVARPGPYLRVLGEGVLRAGDDLTVVHRPGHGVTVSTMFRALNTDHSLLPRLLDVPDLLPKAREKAETYLAAR